MDRALRLADEGSGPGFLSDPKAAERIRGDLNEFGTVDIYEHCRTLTNMFLVLECGVRIEPHDEDQAPFETGESVYLYGEPLTLAQLQQRLQTYMHTTTGTIPYFDRGNEKRSFPTWSGTDGRAV